MIGRGGAAKLVLVGGAGWENEQTLNLLNRAEDLRARVRVVSGLSRPALRRLIANSRGLLMPSFAEGYGLPVVEALTLGAPAIVSDIPIFHEVSQGAARFVAPHDGAGWLAAVEEYAARAPRSRAAATGAFEPPTWPKYFAAVERFVQNLPC
jgi:glycosyltransferase involved in cell wall biosynthesis